MIDLTSDLEARHSEFFNAPEFQRCVGDWTDAKLRATLDKHGIEHDGKFKLVHCPFCKSDDGNPAVGLRNGFPWFKCFREKNGCAEKTFADLQRHVRRPKLKIVNSGDLVAKYVGPRKPVIKGLLRHGDVANIVGGPKTRKSFFVMQAALCVASGTPFLDFETVQGRVLMIDNELRSDDLAQRLKVMATAMNLRLEDVTKNIDIVALRGSLADLGTIRDELCDLPANTYSFCSLDALYKSLPRGTDENSNTDMTAAYVMLDETAEKHNAAVACVHHMSKGSQAGKAVSDLGSGAGAQSRSADVHIGLREHQDENAVVMQAIIRSQKPIEPRVLVFDYPLWKLAPEKNPANLATSTKKTPVTLDDFLATIPTEAAPKIEVLAAAKAQLGVSRDSLLVLLAEAKKRGLIEINVSKGKSHQHQIRRFVKTDDGKVRLA